MDRTLKNIVTTQWSEGAGEKVSPCFPPFCCHCLREATKSIETEFDGVTLAIPYCENHIDSAGKYYNNVVRGKKRNIVRKISIVLSILSGFWIVYCVLPESDILRGTDSFMSLFGGAFGITVTKAWNFDLALMPHWFRILLSLPFSVLMYFTIPPLLDRRVLHKGAYDYGYWVNRKITLVAPGIIDIEIDRTSNNEGRTRCSIAFLKKDFAELFRKCQDEHRLESEPKVI